MLRKQLLTRRHAIWGAPALWAAGFSTRATAAPARRVPVIDVTDLYHPHQDIGGNVDLIAAYALPEIDLQAVILDVTAKFRRAVATGANGQVLDKDGPLDSHAMVRLPRSDLPVALYPCASNQGPFGMDSNHT